MEHFSHFFHKLLHAKMLIFHVAAAAVRAAAARSIGKTKSETKLQ